MLRGHRDAVARPAIKLDDLFLLQFVFDANDDSGVVGCIFQIVDNHAVYFCAEGRHQVPHQIMGEGTFLGYLAHEHGDRTTHRLIDINDEHLVVISDKHRAPAARRQYCPHLNLDHRFVHHANGTRREGKDKRWAEWVVFVS